MGKSDFEIRCLFGGIPFSKLPSRACEKIKQLIFDRVNKYRALRIHSEMSDEELVNSLGWWCSLFSSYYTKRNLCLKFGKKGHRQDVRS